MAYKQISPQSVAEGGTGASTLTDHGVMIGSGTGAVSLVGPVAATGALLASNGVGSDPGFTTATYPLTTTVSEILYSSATNTVTGLATANRGVLTTGATGIPAITALATDGQLIIGSTAGAPAAASITAGSGITVTPGSNSITIAATGGGDVTAASNLTDNAVVRGDGGAKGVQTSTVSITDNGEMTNTSQPAFLAYQNGSQANATGAGTEYTLGTTSDLTEIYDQNSDFDPTTGTFTAPVTGKYLLNVNITLNALTAAMTTGRVLIPTSNRTYVGSFANCGAGRTVSTAPDLYTFSCHVVADMDAADTATFSIAAFGGAGDTAGIIGVLAVETFVSGALFC